MKELDYRTVGKIIEFFGVRGVADGSIPQSLTGICDGLVKVRDAKTLWIDAYSEFYVKFRRPMFSRPYYVVYVSGIRVSLVAAEIEFIKMMKGCIVTDVHCQGYDAVSVFGSSSIDRGEWIIGVKLDSSYEGETGGEELSDFPCRTTDSLISNFDKNKRAFIGLFEPCISEEDQILAETRSTNRADTLRQVREVLVFSGLGSDVVEKWAEIVSLVDTYDAVER
jgi:hypothetical protein